MPELMTITTNHTHFVTTWVYHNMILTACTSTREPLVAVDITVGVL